MRQLFAVALFSLTPLLAHAGEVRDPALLRYLERSFGVCPDSTISVETVQDAAPANFVVYRATQSSSDSRCGGSDFVLVSPASGQVIMADLFRIPFDLRPTETRIEEATSTLMKKRVRATIDAQKLQDGIRRVALTVESKEGPFAYHGWLDESQRFLIVGRRGNLRTDPGKSLHDALGVAGAIGRGPANAPVTVVELSDLQCPACKRAHEPMEKFLAQHGSKIRFVRIDLPLFEGHDWAFRAALAGRAIAKISPEKYWSWVDYVFEHQDEIRPTTIDSVATDFVAMHELDAKKFAALYRSPAERQALLDQVSRAFDNSIYGTPTFIVNGQVVHHGTDADYVREYIASLLKKR